MTPRGGPAKIYYRTKRFLDLDELKRQQALWKDVVAMDFWTRLIGGPASTKNAPDPSNPHHRLASFKRAYNNLLQIWHNGDGDYTDAFLAENARICLRRLTELLNDDERGPTPHLCITFAATSRILVVVAKLAIAFGNDGITHEALGICSLLIDNEEEDFLEDRAFAAELPKFVDAIIKSGQHVADSDTESSMLEVLFGVASKIRLEPRILSIWFRLPLEEDLAPSDRDRGQEFPLFYLLLSYVPREGRCGEFARMGLLYLIETVSASSKLEQWIVEGDMAALMASGLGALYSQLSRKLALTYTKAEVPSILTFAERGHIRGSPGAEETTSASYQAHLATFLASLVFWQDLLEHCTSKDVTDSLLDHFQFLFLQQLLYPSLLESSDVDGGSAVAVLTYLRHIFESVDHPDLVRLTVQYLFGVREESGLVDEPTQPLTAARRRKSADLVAHLAEVDDGPSPDLFNLADLISTSLHSSNQQTVNATLLLLSTMLRRQQHQVSSFLFRTRRCRSTDKQRTVGGQIKEIENLLTLAENLTRFQDLEPSFEHYLYDNRTMLEVHSCSLQLLALPEAPVPSSASMPDRPTKPHVLNMDDPILRDLINIMEDFFHNDVETNLSMTRVLVDLATCGHMRLEGWLLTDPSKYWYSDTSVVAGENDEHETAAAHGLKDPAWLVRQIALSRRVPSWGASALSPVLKTLDMLVRQVESFRQEIDDFDRHLMECRTFIEPLEGPASTHGQGTPSRAQDSPRISPSPSRSQGAMSSITERLRPERGSAGDSRTHSPRGRQPDLPSVPTLVSRLGYLRLSPGRISSSASSRAYSPSPLRPDVAPATPPRLGRSTPLVSATLQATIHVPARGRAGASDHARQGSSVRSTSTASDTTAHGEARAMALGYLLTNVIVLQEFILELAALVEVRGTLFGEVQYL